MRRPKSVHSKDARCRIVGVGAAALLATAALVPLAAVPGWAGAGTLQVTASGTSITVQHPTGPSAGSAPGTPGDSRVPGRVTRHPTAPGCTVNIATGKCTSYVKTPAAPPTPASELPPYFVSGPPKHRTVCRLGLRDAGGVLGAVRVTCTPLPGKTITIPGTPPKAPTPPIVWTYGFAGDAFKVCVHSWSVTYQGQTITQVGSPCTGPFHQSFEVGCKGTGRISASFTLAYLSSFPGWDPTVDAVGSSYGLDRVRSVPAPPGFFPDGTTTISLGSATVVPECPTAGFNTPPATESLFALGPLAAFDTGQPNLFKFEPIVRNGGHLDLPVEWIGFTSFSLGPGTDRRVPDVATTVVLDSNPYEASASVVFKPGPTDPTGSIGRIDAYFNTPSVVTAPYTLSATGTFAVYWGTEFTTLSILPNLRFATPVTLRIAGTRPVFHTVCTGTPPKRTCTQIEEQVPSSVDVSFLPLEKHGTLPNTNQALASATTFDKTHRTVFTRSATATIKVYGPMLNVPRPGTS